MATVGEFTASWKECDRLRLVAGDHVYRIRRLKADDSRVFMVEDASVPVRLFPGLNTRPDLAESIFVLSQHYGISLGQATEHVTHEAASADIARVLSMPVGTIIAVLDRVISAIDGNPVEWRMAWSDLSGEAPKAHRH